MTVLKKVQLSQSHALVQNTSDLFLFPGLLGVGIYTTPNPNHCFKEAVSLRYSP